MRDGQGVTKRAGHTEWREKKKWSKRKKKHVSFFL